MPDFKVIVCAAIQNPAGHIFVARRKLGKVLGGFWEFPGGKLEHGEELEPALLREIKEELNIDVTIDRLLHIKPHKYDHGAVLILFYLAKVQENDPIMKLVDHDDHKWCLPSQIHKLKLLPANKEVLDILNQLP